jgi:hypothetical protein
MRLTAIGALLSIAVLAAAVWGELLLTDFRTRATLEPGRPLRTDIEDTVVFREVRAPEGEPVLAAIERSTGSDFEGLMADLEEADVASPEYGVSQRNVPIRISTTARKHPQGTCATFFRLFLPERGKAESVTFQGRPADGGDRAGKSGLLEFDLRAPHSMVALSMTLDPGENAPPRNCAGEFSVGPVRYPMEALRSVRFDLNSGKRATFRFSRQPGPDGEVRLESSFVVSGILVRHPNGALRGQYSAANSKGISVEELRLHPGSVELSLNGSALWQDAEGRHWREWATQNAGRAVLYLAMDLCLFGGLFWLLRIWPPPPPPPPPPPQPGRPYIFISYAHQDKVHALRLSADLRKGGVDVFFDRNLNLGAVWPKELHARIKGCFAMVVLMTPESTASGYVEREIQSALAAGRPLLPVMVRDTHNFLLNNLHYVDARKSNPAPALIADLVEKGYPLVARAAAGAPTRF